MRFNHKELSFLAQQSKENFVKEGVLLMRDKQEGLFKKGEVFVERYFRLRGNLLFYFKTKDLKSDPLGVLVLERCTIELVVDDEKGNSFMIVYEGDDHTYRFAAKDEDERDCWIQALHIASYECLKMQLQSLREQLQARTGRDPISQTAPTETDMEYETSAGNAEDDPAIEISLSCENLPNDSSGHSPNPFVALYTIIPPSQTTWIQHNHTEVAEKCNSPVFLKTIGFGDMNGVDTYTRVKLTVYNVKERMTGTMSQIGQSIMTLQEVLTAPEMKLRLKLQGPDPLDCGHITVMAWINDANLALCELQNGKVVNDVKLSPKAMRRQSKRVDTLRPMYNNIVTRTFRFDTTNDGVKLLVHEYMGESKFTFDIPSQLLKLWIDEEKSNIQQLQELGQISYELKNVCQEVEDYCMTRQTLYSQHIKYITSLTGPYFKPSVKKSDKELEFIPINLHLQRMTVINETKNTTGWYDNITVGAFTAYAQKYKYGGLHRMLKQQKNTYSQDSTLGGATKVQRACNLVNDVYKIKGEIIHCCDLLCHMAMSGTPEDFKKAMDILADKVRELVSICDTQILQDAAEKYNQSKLEVLPTLNPKTGQPSRKSDIPSSSPPPDDASPEKSWRWSGTDFVKSPTVEPWEMTRLNTEAAVVCLISMVEDLITNKTGAMDRPKWLNEISPAVIKLKSFIELVHQRTVLFMTYLNLMEHKGNIRFMNMIKYRRDICFSHALTALVTGFVTRISTCVQDEDFYHQLLKVGVLAQFEGLLSCQGDEMGMIEDFIIACNDLCHVTFQFCLTSEEINSPTVTLDGLVRDGADPDFFRHYMCVSIPMEEEIFKKLPEELQKGHKIKVTSVFFNIGINEQASLAERFGDTSLQERINGESVAKVFTYVEKYEEAIGNPDAGKSGSGTIKDLCNKLHYNTMTKKSKNTEILKLAAEICRKMKGIRFTSCKSAKDRTAMAVTLEQVHILQQEHDLASHVFTQALDCFRSEGVRRENTLKNVGAKKYAFNSLQLLYIPKLYRPPNGTYGNVQG